MSTTDAVREIEAEDLAQAREMVQTILREWDFISWDELLAPDVVLTLKTGAVGVDRFGLAGGDANLQVIGCDNAKKVLGKIYADLKADLSITAEVVSGYDAALLGNLVLPSMQQGADPISVPLAIYMGFAPEGRIRTMTIAVVDLQPMIEAFRSAIRDAKP